MSTGTGRVTDGEALRRLAASQDEWPVLESKHSTHASSPSPWLAEAWATFASLANSSASHPCGGAGVGDLATEQLPNEMREGGAHYGRLVACMRRRRARRPRTADALTAATAAANRLPLITRERNLANLEGLDAVVV